jgi:hypothetical protein
MSWIRITSPQNKAFRNSVIPFNQIFFDQLSKKDRDNVGSNATCSHLTEMNSALIMRHVVMRFLQPLFTTTERT